MRKIEKGEPAEEFSEIVKRNNLHRWDELDKFPGVRGRVRETILEKEQHGLSGYTERVVRGNASLHVDHFRKRALYHQLELDWNNFIVDERSDDFGACHKDHIIKTTDANEKLIDPVHEDPHHFFTYNENGDIMPRGSLTPEEKKRAEFTIETFNLQHPSLKEQRLTMLCGLRECARDRSCSADEIREAYSTEPFPSLLEFFLERLGKGLYD